MEFDRYLLVHDKKESADSDSYKAYKIRFVKRTYYIGLFPNVNALQIQKAMHSMIFYNHLLIAPHRPKRKFIYTLLKVTGNDKEMHGLVMKSDTEFGIVLTVIKNFADFILML